MKILPLDEELVTYLKKHNLTIKFEKQLKLLEFNLRHPSLHTEILEPKERGIKSFRIDLKFRAIFIYDQERDELEVITINKHYQ